MDSKIYTKKGDKGKTSLLSGQKVAKFDLRLEAYGTVDELNSWTGMIRSYETDSKSKESLIKIQEKLFSLSSRLAYNKDDAKYPIAELPEICQSDIEFLEMEIDRMNEEMPPLSNFIIPGGDLQVSSCHISRTICRRAERRVVELTENAVINHKIITFLNRLSDYFFVLARYFNYNKNLDENFWKNED